MSASKAMMVVFVVERVNSSFVVGYNPEKVSFSYSIYFCEGEGV